MPGEARRAARRLASTWPVRYHPVYPGATAAAGPKTSVHSSKGRLVVTRMDPRSQRWLKNSKSGFAPTGDRGPKPSSSMISRLSRDSCRCRLKGGFGSCREAIAEVFKVTILCILEPPQQLIRPEDLGPLVEGQVGGDQDGPALAALAEELEERFRPDGGQGEAEAGTVALRREAESSQVKKVWQLPTTSCQKFSARHTRRSQIRRTLR